MKTTVTRALSIAISSATISAIALTGAAHADRQGAPIRYATPSSVSAPSPDGIQPQTPSFQRSQPTVNAQQRVEFSYPGAPSIESAPLSKAPVAAETMAALGAPVVSTAPVAAETMKALGASATTTAGKLVLDATPKTVFAATSLAGGPFGSDTSQQDTPAPASAPSQPIRIAALQTNKPVNAGKPLTLSRVKVNRDAPVGEERGKASIYADGYNGTPTANGEIFDETAMTAAHPSLPLPSLVQVINEDNRREVVVRVNDRGPFDGKRILELSPRAGTVLGMSKTNSANVRVRYLGPAPVKQNPSASAPVQSEPDTFASNSVMDESLPPVTSSAPVVTQPSPLTTVADYGEPSLGVPDPVQPIPASAPAARGNVYIQAGAFADIANAQSLTRALDRNLSVKIEEARVNGGDYFRVLIGPFANNQAAEVHRSQLSQAGIVNGFLTTR